MWIDCIHTHINTQRNRRYTIFSKSIIFSLFILSKSGRGNATLEKLDKPEEKHNDNTYITYPSFMRRFNALINFVR